MAKKKKRDREKAKAATFSMGHFEIRAEAIGGRELSPTEARAVAEVGQSEGEILEEVVGLSQNLILYAYLSARGNGTAQPLLVVSPGGGELFDALEKKAVLKCGGVGVADDGGEIQGVVLAIPYDAAVKVLADHGCNRPLRPEAIQCFAVKQLAGGRICGWFHMPIPSPDEAEQWLREMAQANEELRRRKQQQK